MRVDIPVSGFSAAVRRQELRAANIANLDTPGYQAKEAETVELQGGGAALGPVRESMSPAAPGASNVVLAEEITGTLTDLRAAQANARTLRAQDDLLGETLDILA